MLSDINGRGLEETSKDIEALGCEVVRIVADVSDPESVKELVDKALRHCGSLHFLINVAGTALMGAIEQHDLSDWHRVIDTRGLANRWLRSQSKTWRNTGKHQQNDLARTAV